VNYLICIHNLRFLQSIWLCVVIDNSIIKTLIFSLDILKLVHNIKSSRYRHLYKIWSKTRKQKLIQPSTWTLSSSHILLINRATGFTKASQIASTSSVIVRVNELNKLALYKLPNSVHLFLHVSNLYSRFIYNSNLWMVLNINYLYKFVNYSLFENSVAVRSKLLFVININKI
jgi:hypothetical protein